MPIQQAIKLGDFVAHLKRLGNWGQVAITSDQPTTDILLSVNKRASRIWGAADWKWYKELLSFNLVPNTRQYAVAAASGNYIDRILSLIPYDSTGTFLQGKPLTERTDRAFYDRIAAPAWTNSSGVGSPAYNVGSPTDYYSMGIDVNGFWNITVDPVPNLASKMGGWAKPVLFSYLLADVVANVAIQYFPNNIVLGALFEGCMSDIMRVRQQDGEAIRLDQSFEAKIKQLAAEQIGVATDNTPITTALPATVNRMRRRGRTW